MRHKQLRILLLAICLNGMLTGYGRAENDILKSSWDELLELEEQIDYHQSCVDSARRKVNGVPLYVTFKNTYKDSSNGGIATRYELYYGSLFTQNINPRLRSTLGIDQRITLGLDATYRIYNFSLAGLTELWDKKIDFTVGTIYLNYGPLKVSVNLREEDVEPGGTNLSRNFWGGQIITNISGLGIDAWFAKRFNHSDDIILGVHTGLDLLPTLYTDVLFYNVRNGSINTSLLSFSSKKNSKVGNLLIDHGYEYNLSIDDQDQTDSITPMVDKALVIDLEPKIKLMSRSIPMELRYLYVGPDYLKSISSEITGLLPALPESYVFRPQEDNPYFYDFYVNQKGLKTQLGPIKLGALGVNFFAEKYCDIAPTKGINEPRKFDHKGGIVSWRVPKLFPQMDTELVVGKHIYSTKREELVADKYINLDVEQFSSALDISLIGNKKIHLERELVTDKGNFNSELRNKSLTINRIAYSFEYDKTIVDLSVDFKQVQSFTSKHNEQLLRLRTKTAFYKSTLYFDGTINLVGTAVPQKTTSFTVKQRFYF